MKSTNLAFEKACYEDIFSDHNKQKVVTSIFHKLLEIRKRMLENKEEKLNNLSNPTRLLKNSYYVQPYIILLTILLGREIIR